MPYSYFWRIDITDRATNSGVAVNAISYIDQEIRVLGQFYLKTDYVSSTLRYVFAFLKVKSYEEKLINKFLKN